MSTSLQERFWFTLASHARSYLEQQPSASTTSTVLVCMSKSARSEPALSTTPACWSRLSIVAADLLARAFGTILAGMPGELEPEVDEPRA